MSATESGFGCLLRALGNSQTAGSLAASLSSDVHAEPPADRSSADAAEWDEARSKHDDNFTAEELCEDLYEVRNVLLAAVKSGYPLAVGAVVQAVHSNALDRLADFAVYGSPCTNRQRPEAVAAKALLDALTGARGKTGGGQ